eukprot:381482_1
MVTTPSHPINIMTFHSSSSQSFISFTPIHTSEFPNVFHFVTQSFYDTRSLDTNSTTLSMKPINTMPKTMSYVLRNICEFHNGYIQRRQMILVHLAFVRLQAFDTNSVLNQL